MLEALLEWDRNTLAFLNMSGGHTVFLDFFMWMATQILIWLPAFLTFFYVVIKNKKKEAFLIIGIVILLFLLCDQISSSIIKPLVARPRPGRDPLVMDLLQYVNDYRGGRFGYLSSHAANSFGFALFSSLLFKYRWYSVVVFLWAFICAYTRLYLGVHFPLDIISGMLLGLLIGWFCYWLYGKLRELFPQYALNNRSFDNRKCSVSGFALSDIYLLLYSLAVILFSIVCFALQMGKFF